MNVLLTGGPDFNLSAVLIVGKISVEKENAYIVLMILRGRDLMLCLLCSMLKRF